MKKVVIVEDNEFVLSLMEKNLRKDFLVKIFDSPVNALEYCKDNDVDLIVTDQNMPEMKGTQFISLVHKHKKIPFILISGDSDLKNLPEQIFFLKKPFSPKSLSAIINDLTKDVQSA